MNIGNFEVSKGFFITIAAIACGYLLIPSLVSKGNLDSASKSEEQRIADSNKHYEKVVSSAENLTISDANLQRCIVAASRDRAKIPPFNSGAINSVTELKLLHCGKRNITSLSGIEQLKQLTFLDISYNNIADLSPLRNHPSLETLLLRSNPIRSILELSSMAKIDYVELPRLKNTSCSTIKKVLSGVRHNLPADQCKQSNSPSQVNNPAMRASPSKRNSTDYRIEQELLEFETQY